MVWKARPLRSKDDLMGSRQCGGVFISSFCINLLCFFIPPRVVSNWMVWIADNHNEWWITDVQRISGLSLINWLPSYFCFHFYTWFCCCRSPFKSGTALASRLCKAAMLHRFKLVAKEAQRQDLLATSSYREAKVSFNVGYSIQHSLYVHQKQTLC